jgi:hypothetical protein
LVKNLLACFGSVRTAQTFLGGRDRRVRDPNGLASN